MTSLLGMRIVMIGQKSKINFLFNKINRFRSLLIDFFSKIRKNIIEFACSQELKDCVTKAINYFNEFMLENLDRIPSGLRYIVFCTGIKHGGLVEYKYLYNKYYQTYDPMLRQEILHGLTCAKELTNISRLFEKELEMNNFLGLKTVLATGSNDYKASNLIAWNSVKKLWPMINK